MTTAMDEQASDGSLVLERLAAIGEDQNFLDAVDSDDVGRARRLMARAGLNEATITNVVNKMLEGDAEL